MENFDDFFSDLFHSTTVRTRIPSLLLSLSMDVFADGLSHRAGRSSTEVGTSQLTLYLVLNGRV
jgi:hypothetical protein